MQRWFSNIHFKITKSAKNDEDWFFLHEKKPTVIKQIKYFALLLSISIFDALSKGSTYDVL